MRQRLDALSLAALTGLAITASSWLLDKKAQDPMPPKIKDQITATIARNLHEEPSKIADRVLALSHVETPSEPGRYERLVVWTGGDPSSTEPDTVEATFTLEMRDTASKKPEPWYIDEDQGIAVPMRMVEHEGRRYRRVE